MTVETKSENPGLKSQAAIYGLWDVRPIIKPLSATVASSEKLR